jgi:carbon storage regulator CsrA
MLVLQRNTNERIVIEGGIVITVVTIGCRGNGTRFVRLGVDAPRSVRVDREEIDQQRKDGPRC